MIKDIKCPKCGGDDWIKKGFSNDGEQRYGCNACHKYTSILSTTTKTKTDTNNYHNDLWKVSAWDNDGKLMDIDKYCKFYKLPRNDIRSYKLCTNMGKPYYNIVFYETLEKLDFLTEDYFINIVKKYSKPVTEIIIPENKNHNVTRVVYTDVHIGMDPNKTGTAIFDEKWNEEKQHERFIIMATSIINYGSGRLIVDELGDYVDGWDAKTVRKQHDLPQNMTNEEAFDIAVKLKIEFCDLLIKSCRFSSMEFNNICNDNHAGSFGYVVNSAVKSILEVKYPGLVKVTNYRKFINHYFVGKHVFIISHGKDKDDLKFGFKPILSYNAEKKITNYIIEYDLRGFIEFSKGDSHRYLMDMSTSAIFDYCNYTAFCPPSQWVQTNYQRGKSGYCIQLFNENEKDKIMIPRFF